MHAIYHAEVLMSEFQFITHNEAGSVRFNLTGRLSGAEVESLHQAWQREALTDVVSVIVDISLVDGADEHGRALLAIMHRFGAQIIAGSPESLAIAQPIVTDTAAAASVKFGWFRRLMRLLFENRCPVGAHPRAEMICLTSAGRNGVSQHLGFGDFKEV
jgi:hypothetical protein